MNILVKSIIIYVFTFMSIVLSANPEYPEGFENWSFKDKRNYIIKKRETEEQEKKARKQLHKSNKETWKHREQNIENLHRRLGPMIKDLDLIVELVELKYDNGQSSLRGIEFLKTISQGNYNIDLSHEIQKYYQQIHSCPRHRNTDPDFFQKLLKNISTTNPAYEIYEFIADREASFKFKNAIQPLDNKSFECPLSVEKFSQFNFSVGVFVGINLGFSKKVYQTLLGRRFSTKAMLSPLTFGGGFTTGYYTAHVNANNQSITCDDLTLGYFLQINSSQLSTKDWTENSGSFTGIGNGAFKMKESNSKSYTFLPSDFCNLVNILKI